MDLYDCLMVGAGGFIGSVLRYIVGLIPMREGSTFPVKTMCVNVAGAFLIGIIAASVLRHGDMSPRMVLFLKVGICGGFTTFSTFALESVGLLQSGKSLQAILYIVFSVVLSIFAVILAESVVK